MRSLLIVGTVGSRCTVKADYAANADYTPRPRLAGRARVPRRRRAFRPQHPLCKLAAENEGEP